MECDSKACAKFLALMLVVISLGGCGKAIHSKSKDSTISKTDGFREITIRVRGVENFVYTFEAGEDRIFHCDV